MFFLFLKTTFLFIIKFIRDDIALAQINETSKGIDDNICVKDAVSGTCIRKTKYIRHVNKIQSINVANKLEKRNFAICAPNTEYMRIESLRGLKWDEAFSFRYTVCISISFIGIFF